MRRLNTQVVAFLRFDSIRTNRFNRNNATVNEFVLRRILIDFFAHHSK